MSALFTSRRQAERFAVLVDAGDGGARGDARIEELLETVSALRVLADTAPEPRPEFTTDLRARLLAEADTALVPTQERLLLTHTRSRRRPARLVAASVALVVAGGTAGVAVAAEHSLPGQSLYTLKQGLETAGRTLQLSQADRGRTELGQASTRLAEAAELLRRGDTDEVAPTLKRFTTTAGSGADQLFTAYQADADPADVTAVRDFAATAMTQLSALSSSLPAESEASSDQRAELQRAADLLTGLDQEAQVLCPQCGSAQPLQPPGSLAAAPVALDLPPAAQSAIDEATSATLPRASQAAAADPAQAVGPASATPSGAAGSTSAAAPVTQAGASASSAVKNTVPSAVGSTVAGVTNQVTTAVAGVVDAATGTVDDTVKGVGGLLGATPTP